MATLQERHSHGVGRDGDRRHNRVRYRGALHLEGHPHPAGARRAAYFFALAAGALGRARRGDALRADSRAEARVSAQSRI